ncbi:MAG: Deoxycytidylate deaminase [Microgenomates group bacterium GW2011_GWC1_43_13]|uniref:Deoxycytidylate deaminase n=2 Tax=Candidatus Woeseibacteriota TaxID=1752722 RepID=A0A837I9Z9_9BACT|nr:MAG: Deoxycytidylate deaminase [Microgenomates group bacterium GW2011_GWC1_43_13]KKT32465.1 MAG: Deoxycytidylate deaminase [Candidatus Woesebacteria bacterium GW2011_GWB1_44_11]KKT54902.1 MAG: Deoxycytidylate deaminase [Candidatus Woesebacteria bacterium GW2011_GWA1_44_23]
MRLIYPVAVTSASEMSKEYLRQAYEFAAKNSTDRSTQNGAILVDGSGRVVAWGTNCFPKGVVESPERLERPAKYLYVVHAEHASILYAARNGVKTEGLRCTEAGLPVTIARNQLLIRE